MRRASLVLVACAAALAAAAQASAATGEPSFALRPLTYDPAHPETKSYFVLDKEPGASVTDKVRVTNTGPVSGMVRLYAVDATTGQTSGTVYLGKSAPRHDVGRWVDLGSTVLTLGPGESRVVAFTVRVPPGARTGDHVGGIVAENAVLTTESGQNSGLNVRIQHLTVAAVVVRVPGQAAPSLGVDRVFADGGHGYQFVKLGLTNSGNVMMRPRGSLLLRTSSGGVVARLPLRLDTLIPQTSVDLPVPLGRSLAPGSYTAAVALHYGNRVLVNGQGVGGPLSYRHTFAFKVTAAQNKQVYSGAPQLTRPAAHGGGGSSVLLITIAVVSGALALMSIGVTLTVVMRRRVTL